ncbi:MAG: prepilin-type N-terminal cleavage/methylation domain-containing protein [Thermodesulfobacteriota bacterium]|nr:prepilin-type N-terminal cleavage/methylation domain-containing protein [Thermodesulfobacteriota bacterium]
MNSTRCAKSEIFWKTPCRRNGFTLVELLIAVTASVIVVALALGIYRDTAKSENVLRDHYERYFLRTRLTNLLSLMLSRQTGPVYGDREHLVFLTDINLLGYGRELVMVSGQTAHGQDHLQISIVPERFAGPGTIAQKAAGFFQFPNTDYDYSHRERIRGFSPRFSYNAGYESFSETAGAKDLTLTIVLVEGDGHEWFIAGPRQG